MTSQRPLHLCLVYDCLFPWTVGGAERWMRSLAEALVADGHRVTYLTRLQWDPDDVPDLPGITVVPVSRSEPLYGPDGNRTIGEPLRFGWGVLRHLARHGRDYDVVHAAAFPYFSLLAVGVARRLPHHRYRVIADWHEVWSDAYWAEYLDGLRGWVAGVVQQACARVPQRPFCFSELHASRLATLRPGRVPPVVLRGGYTGPVDRPVPAPVSEDSPQVVFAARMIPDKRAPALVPALRLAAQEVPGLRGVFFGDGPERQDVTDAIAALDGVPPLRAPGFVDGDELRKELAGALCMALPSVREGFGIVVVEAASLGVPSIVVREVDNAATELVIDGVNGVIARSAAPEDLAEAIVRIHRAGAELRESTADWFALHARELSMSTSLQRVVESYRPNDASVRS